MMRFRTQTASYPLTIDDGDYSSLVEIPAVRFTGLQTSGALEKLTVEEPLEIQLVYGSQSARNTKSVSVTMRTPGHDFELAAGFLHTEGVIRDYVDIVDMRYAIGKLTANNNRDMQGSVQPYRSNRNTVAVELDLERNAGQVKDAITDLEAVLAKYPRSRDALRELGFSYYQQHDYPQSRDTYERLQAVDPDDLAAHYQLAILYRRLGDKARAAIESAKFADQKDDPTASTYALEFLGKHPEVAAESVAWHTHDLTGDPVKKPTKIEYTYIPGAGR
jgi:tetratricopeptide (TPR) repeat protein